MSRLLRPLSAAIVLALAGACSRPSGTPAAALDGAVDAVGAAKMPAAVDAAGLARAMPRSEAVFSAPIAAGRAGHVLVVGGLVVSEGVIRIVGFPDDASPWSTDALHGVAWVADADLKLQATTTGIALAWRGDVSGKVGTTLVILGPRGEPRGAPFPVGAGWCVTDEGVAWLDPHGPHPVHARARRWSEPAERDVLEVSPERAPTLLCGRRDAFLLGDGDDDLTSRAFSLGQPATPPPPAGAAVVAIRDQDFGEDDEREHEAFTMVDDVGLIRVGESGTVAVREIGQGHSVPWHRLKHALAQDDDLVAVDGDATGTVIVSTREGGDPCTGSEGAAQSVRALHVDRATGDESLLILAPASCESVPGPFWIGSSPGGPVVAWGDRRAQPGPGEVSIEHLSYRVLSGARPTEGRLDLQADALVDAGCDETGCFAAALLRAKDGDAMQPGPIVGLRYP
jgi:hypothetical protein